MTDPYGDTEWPVDDKGATQPPDQALTDPVIPKAPPTGFEDSSGGAGTPVAVPADSGGVPDITGEALVAAAVAVGVAAAAPLVAGAAAAVGAQAAAAAAAAYVFRMADARVQEADEDQTARDVRDAEGEDG